MNQAVILEGALTILICGIAAWVSVFVVYYLVLGILYFCVQEKTPSAAKSYKNFVVIVPAHNEELMIGTAIDSWRQVDYPTSSFAVYVVADNCTDGTADVVLSKEVKCLVRSEPTNKGKGQALSWAIDRVPLDRFDAVVFVDADCTVSGDFLRAMNDRLMSGAKVIQGFDGVRNPDESIMTRLMQITNVMKNLLFAHAKSKLGLSVPLMGTGMCFDTRVIKQVAWSAFSIGEDLEQYAYLIRAGLFPEFEPRAIVYAHEASTLAQAYTQRVRWAAARMQQVGLGGRTLMSGLKCGDVRLIDAALTLLAPNYAMLANLSLMGLIGSMLLDIPPQQALVAWFLLLVGAQGLYFAMGMTVSRMSFKSLASLLFAPVFLVWKLGIDLVALTNVRQYLWVRATRPTESAKREIR